MFQGLISCLLIEFYFKLILAPLTLLKVLLTLKVTESQYSKFDILSLVC